MLPRQVLSEENGDPQQAENSWGGARDGSGQKRKSLVLTEAIVQSTAALIGGDFGDGTVAAIRSVVQVDAALVLQDWLAHLVLSSDADVVCESPRWAALHRRLLEACRLAGENGASAALVTSGALRLAYQRHVKGSGETIKAKCAEKLRAARASYNALQDFKVSDVERESFLMFWASSRQYNSNRYALVHKGSSTTNLLRKSQAIEALSHQVKELQQSTKVNSSSLKTSNQQPTPNLQMVIASNGGARALDSFSAQVSLDIKMESKMSFNAISKIEKLFYLKHFHCLPPENWGMSSKGEISTFLALCFEDTMKMRKAVKARIDKWEFYLTCMDGSQRGKRMSRLQVSLHICLCFFLCF